MAPTAPRSVVLFEFCCQPCSSCSSCPRLITAAFSLLLLGSLGLLAWQLFEPVVALLTTTLLIASPAFLELSGSCMLEIPGLALGVAALVPLLIPEEMARWRFKIVCSGFLFGLALETKLTRLPQIHSCLVLDEIERYRPQVKWLFAADPVYSFHAGIPMPPRLALLPLKRFWSGDMTNVRLADEMERARPGLVLLPNDGRETAFTPLLRAEYRLVYEDARLCLHARKSVLEQR